ncbi:MAG: hypothetical protein GY832_33465 [Chloroflexi bacterium]|nr:hypothetical protein [Chloroflexota bacterium]
MSPDTIVPDPGNPQSFNRYSYVVNNPLKYTDPSGHDPVPPIKVRRGSCFFDGALVVDWVELYHWSLDNSNRANRVRFAEKKQKWGKSGFR